jgi:hypothetical protein
MPRTPRLTGALRGRRKAAALLGTAAALAAGAGTASAATVAATSHGTPVQHAATAAAVAHEHVQHAVEDRAVVQRRAPAPQTAPRHAGAPSAQTDSAPARPYQIYDSVTPSAIPAGHEVATYADGPYAASPSAMQGKHVLWIDTNGSDTHASALDVEPGDVTPSGAGSWAAQKLHADPQGQAIIYTMRSEWSAAQAAVRAALPSAEQSHVRWWIADPTGVPHVVPGSSATQWYWGSNYDISTATPGF